MAHRVTLLPGDTTGPEIVNGIAQILDAMGVDIDWDVHKCAEGLTPEALASARATGHVLMAYYEGQRAQGHLPPIVQLRTQLGVFANVRPVHSVKGLSARHPDVDLIIVRETTEDVYAHLEHESIPGVFESLKVTTEAACERIARFGFELAREQGRRKVSIVHKANIMKMSDGLFLRTARRVAEEYPDIECDDHIVDALCMKLAIFPDRFDVLLAGNLFGDIVSDLGAGLVGGRSNCPSVNVGDGVTVYSSGHGDSRDCINNGTGDPLSLLFVTVLMLRRLGEAEAADRLMAGVGELLAEGTRPLGAGGQLSCTGFLDGVTARVRA